MTHTELKNSKIVVTIEITGLDIWGCEDFNDQDVTEIMNSIGSDIIYTLNNYAGLESVEITGNELIKGKYE